MEKTFNKRHILSLPEFTKSREFWMNKLRKNHGETRLPYSYYPTSDYNEKTLSITFPDTLYTQLEKVSKNNLEALFITLLATYRITLYKYTNQISTEIGIPVLSGVNSEIIDNSQILPVLHDLVSSANFKDSLKQEKEAIASVYHNQHYPLSEIDLYKLPKTALALKNIHHNYKHTELSFIFSKLDSGLELEIKYNSLLFSEEFISMLGRKYIYITNTLLSQASDNIEDIDFVEEHERETFINVINKTEQTYPSDSNLVAIFQKWAQNTPDEIAVVMGEDSLTYRQLDLYSNRIANYLTESQQLKKNELVGILLPKSYNSVACILGILKAGGAYLPLSPKYPSDRLRTIIGDSKLRVMISSKNHIKLLNKLQWECQSFSTFMCIDTHDCHKEKEENTFKNELNDRKLWEYVGEKAKDDIEGGGWQNSYTGANISRQEMNEYRNNIVTKLTPYLGKNVRVLEIGCASGISMYEIAPQVSLYYGTDISRTIIEKNQVIVAERNLSNIKLKSLTAHEIDQVEEKDFDIVIINSVIQCFEGHNYLIDVFNKVIGLLKDQGLLFIGDIMNEDTREAFLESLNSFKRDNVGKGYKVKTDFSNEIFYSRDFFEDLRTIIPEIITTEFSEKIHTFENELTRYRYDALLHIDKKAPKRIHKKHKQQHSLSKLETYTNTSTPSIKIKPDDWAYILYTSGSTGKPKGVIVSHKNVLRLVKNTNYLPFEKGDKMLQAAPMEFDAASFEIWGALANGLEVHIIDSEVFLNAERLKKYIIDNKVNTSVIISSTFVALLEQDIDVFRGFKHLLVGGEALSAHHINKLREHHKTLNLSNAYGPTENTVISTYYPIKKQHKGSIPIGKPISNSSCYVLDSKKRLVMPGTEGLLYVGGDGVALGYLNSPELTAERFIPSPFKEGEKLYYTGDLVRWNENYDLEFIGRIDTQVKIRGHRVETGEIENEILNISNIKAAKVIVKLDTNNENFLAAYYSAATKINGDEILSILEDKLPNYMVPSIAIQLDALPLNANGKLDTAKLPDILSQTKTIFETPRNEIEKQLVTIWKEVLGVPNLSINDNFFELGGHSLKAMKVLHKLSKNFELKLTHLFKYPTIKELSENLIYKKDHLLETLKHLKEEPLDVATLQNTKTRMEWYKNRIQQDEFSIPGEELVLKNILLTGATGYLGIHLLKELIDNTTAKIHVLIRATNEIMAKERLLQKLNFYFGESFYYEHSERIFITVGEMSKPNLGMADDTYNYLCEHMDTIINPAANVKHYGQDSEYLGNTLGVETLVKIAKTNKPKRIHHISTAGVSFGQGYAFSEYDRVDMIPEENNTTYLQSKLDAEKIIFKAMDEGVEAVIHRVGNLMFNTETGKFQENTENSAFYMLLRSFIHLGIMPDMKHKFYDFSFINTTAKAILKIAKQKTMVNDTFHVYNANAYSLNDLYHILVKPNFPNVKLVQMEDFPTLILQKYEDPKMKEFIEHIIVNIRILEIKESNVMVVSDRSQAIMEKLSIKWHPLNNELVNMMLNFGKEKKFW